LNSHIDDILKGLEEYKDSRSSSINKYRAQEVSPRQIIKKTERPDQQQELDLKLASPKSPKIYKQWDSPKHWTAQKQKENEILRDIKFKKG